MLALKAPSTKTKKGGKLSVPQFCASVQLYVMALGNGPVMRICLQSTGGNTNSKDKA